MTAPNLNNEELNNDLLIADALLRLKTLEDLLIKKGVFTVEEYNEVMSNIASVIAKSLLEKSNVQGNLDDIVASLKNKVKNN